MTETTIRLDSATLDGLDTLNQWLIVAYQGRIGANIYCWLAALGNLEPDLNDSLFNSIIFNSDDPMKRLSLTMIVSWEPTTGRARMTVMLPRALPTVALSGKSFMPSKFSRTDRWYSARCYSRWEI